MMAEIMAAMDRKGLAAILARLKAATGPDRELDAWITWATVAPAGAEVVIGPVTGEIRIRTGKGSFTGQDIVWPEWPTWRDAKPTASIDAAVRLVERALPGWIWDVTSTGTAWVMPFGDTDELCQASASSSALALCAALARALLARLDATPSPE